MSSPRKHWDIFCNVVDHFGDIAVSWRLARQLVREHRYQVRLWVDQIETFAQFRPEVDASCAKQLIDGVEVLHWTPQTRVEHVAQVVVEAFGSRVPEDYLQRMAQAPRAPVWITLEYLSAESWIEPCHMGASPHPATGLMKHFFFPGFTPRTGGLIREHDLEDERQGFLADRHAIETLCREWGIEPSSIQGATRISLFGYGGAAVTALLEGWANGNEPIVALVPESRILPDVSNFAGQGALAAGDRIERGALSIVVLPFLPQDTYDRLLWWCHCNFVRGEDSFVRAQWAKRPFVWSIYPQEGGAHWTKLYMFLERYCETLPAECVSDMREFWRSWNRGEPSVKTLSAAWSSFWQHRTLLEARAIIWADALTTQGDLAHHLSQFVTNQV